MDHIDPAWIVAAADWASQWPEVQEVWFWGSRVSGVSRTGAPVRSDSDLDVAILVEGRTEQGRYGNEVWMKSRLAEHLRPLVSVEVHIEAIRDTFEIVTPERVKAGGILVFSKKEPTSRSARD